jgi:hypothetical protein
VGQGQVKKHASDEAHKHNTVLYYLLLKREWSILLSLRIGLSGTSTSRGGKREDRRAENAVFRDLGFGCYADIYKAAGLTATHSGRNGVR